MPATDDTEETSEPPVACTLTDEQREARIETDRETFHDYFEGAEELADGYRLRFEGTPEALAAVADFVGREAECCSFADFTIEYERPYDEVGLRFTGPKGTMALLEEGFAEALGAFPNTS